MIAKGLYRIGSKIRNPSLERSMKLLKDSESWDLEELECYQVSRLKDLVRFASVHSPYYRKVFRQLGFDPDGVTCLGQLADLPTITKAELIEFSGDIHTTGSHTFKKIFVAETSGSTGEPLMFYKNEEWDSWNRAALFRGYSWYGVNPWDRNGYFWGYNIAPSKAWKTKFMDALQNRFRVFSYDQEELSRFVYRLTNCEYLHGYSSMIYEAARIINEIELEDLALNLKLVKGTSEKIHAHYHEEVKKAFGQKIVSEYGAAEAGIVAFECPAGSMHLNMEGCIVEEDKGEIVVTNLNAYSFPIIRYKLGDSIVLEDESFECPCGMKHRVLREVTGRVGKRIYGKEKKYPSLVVYNIVKNLYLKKGLSINAQFLQRERGKLEISVEEPLTGKSNLIFEAELKLYFGLDMDWTIKAGEAIHTMKGKRKDFISEIE